MADRRRVRHLLLLGLPTLVAAAVAVALGLPYWIVVPIVLLIAVLVIFES
ncbi:MAG: hypothetical protein KatS3mg008_0530 [Acidimicrobiales bacterium]|nr:MAG: hypothetical protein KatS3mg008_0530 [Acidimicrobiales bacterium]